MSQTPHEGAGAPELFPGKSTRQPDSSPMDFGATESTPQDPVRKKRARRKITASRDTAGFFQLPKPHSLVKARIVSKYFKSWANIIKPRATEKKMAYFDLFSGPGAYDDGTPSTPLLIMNTILADPVLRDQMITLFADKEQDCIDTLRANIAALPGIDTLRYAPQIERMTAQESKLDETFAVVEVIPSFMFLDPFGYEGVTVKLINAILKSWGCDVVFFFCFMRMPGAIMNNVVRSHMDALFGTARVEELRKVLPTVGKDDKEKVILSALEAALNVPGKRFVQTFRFLNARGTVTHHLVFVTKNPTAYKIMKDIMANESSTFVDGVASFAFQENAPQPLFNVETPIDDLMADLLKRFSGKTIAVKDMIAQHIYGTRYVDKNYQEALARLAFDKHAITAARGAHSPPINPSKRKIPLDNTYITFP
ncbi:MAG: three-Cys-motif partner protein TcmP [Candidatus Eremiobacteraeota bacterium]|nr:three-Cys-motif partner protein TcmP [Candidatus Eremiobacteraeota bacterium]